MAEIVCLQKAIKEAKAAIEIVILPPFYPSGDEQSLVYEVLGRTVPERGLPLDVGVVVYNVWTVVDVWNVTQGKTVTHKILSIVGEVDNHTLLQVPLGTPIKDCLTQAKMKSGEMAVLLGGHMMGR
ncbi:MAG: proton-conducting membrane transporter, partial [Eubacterium aggregans]